MPCVMPPSFGACPPLRFGPARSLPLGWLRSQRRRPLCVPTPAFVPRNVGVKHTTHVAATQPPAGWDVLQLGSACRQRSAIAGHALTPAHRTPSPLVAHPSICLLRAREATQCEALERANMVTRCELHLRRHFLAFALSCGHGHNARTTRPLSQWGTSSTAFNDEPKRLT